MQFGYILHQREVHSLESWNNRPFARNSSLLSLAIVTIWNGIILNENYCCVRFFFCENQLIQNKQPLECSPLQGKMFEVFFRICLQQSYVTQAEKKIHINFNLCLNSGNRPRIYKKKSSPSTTKKSVMKSQTNSK